MHLRWNLFLVLFVHLSSSYECESPNCLRLIEILAVLVPKYPGSNCKVKVVFCCIHNEIVILSVFGRRWWSYHFCQVNQVHKLTICFHSSLLLALSFQFFTHFASKSPSTALVLGRPCLIFDTVLTYSTFSHCSVLGPSLHLLQPPYSLTLIHIALAARHYFFVPAFHLPFYLRTFSEVFSVPELIVYMRLQHRVLTSRIHILPLVAVLFYTLASLLFLKFLLIPKSVQTSCISVSLY